MGEIGFNSFDDAARYAYNNKINCVILAVPEKRASPLAQPKPAGAASRKTHQLFMGLILLLLMEEVKHPSGVHVLWILELMNR